MIEEAKGKRLSLIVDGVLRYRDDRFPMGSECACRLRVWRLKDDRNAVMATELDPAPGASVTNTAERWAEEACVRYNLNPFKTVFIENYDRRDSETDPYFPSETFDFVSFTWRDGRASSPDWRYGGRAAIEELLGEKLP